MKRENKNQKSLKILFSNQQESFIIKTVIVINFEV